MKKLLALCCLLIPHTLRSFTTIDQVYAYTQRHSNTIEPANHDLINPDYTWYYKQNGSSWGERALAWAGIWKSQWYRFYDLLVDYTKHHAPEQRQALVIKSTPHTQCIIMSNILGDLHSCVRILMELYKQGIIDTHFKIIKPEVYIIFNGNIIGDSVYNLELLELLINLLNANPTQVLAVRGLQEDKEYWQDHTLGLQLPYIFGPSYQLSRYLRHFFTTFPVGVYIVTQEHKDSPLRISYTITDPEFNQLMCSPSALPNRAFCLTGRTPGHKEGTVSALIVGESHDINYTDTYGLVHTTNPSIWHLISSPSGAYRAQFGFHYDSFITVAMGTSAQTTRLTLYTHDTQQQNSRFISKGPYALVPNVTSGKVP